MSDDARCDVCGWPLRDRREDGCVVGDCSMRPRPSPTHRERQVAAAIIETATRGYVSQAEHDAMRAERDTARAQCVAARDRLDDVLDGRDRARAELDAARRDLEVVRALADTAGGQRDVAIGQRDAAMAAAKREQGIALSAQYDMQAALIATTEARLERNAATSRASRDEAEIDRLTVKLHAAIARAERQAAELRAAQEQAERRNRELDALHYVWCDGGCDSGVHRWADGKPDEQTVREAVRNTARLVSWYRNAAARRGEVPPNFGNEVAAEAIARAERLATCVQMCCDGSSEDDPATLCARRVSELIARAERAERLCVRLGAKLDPWLTRKWPGSAYDMARYELPADWREQVEAMRERVKP